jgi:hypothetical protein
LCKVHEVIRGPPQFTKKQVKKMLNGDGAMSVPPEGWAERALEAELRPGKLTPFLSVPTGRSS